MMEQMKPQAEEEKRHAKYVRRIYTLRITVFITLTSFAGVLGAASYLYLRSFETANLKSQMEASVTQLENTIRNGLVNKITSSRLLGNIYKHTLKTDGGVFEGTFPEVILPGYATIAKDLLTLGTYSQLYWMPLVNATNRGKFEAFAKKNIKYFSSNVTSTIQTINNTLYTYGIWHKPNASSSARDTLPIPQADRRFNQWMFPVFQLANLNAPVDTTASSFFFDPHSTTMGGRQATMDIALNTTICAFTDFLVTVEDEKAGRSRPASIFYTPVYSLQKNIIGAVGADTYWDTIIQNSLPNNLKRIDCVLSSKQSTWTISIDQGRIIVDGHEGDYHDTSMTSYGTSVSLDLTLGGTITATKFTITAYPSKDFYNQYITDTPFVACFVMVAALVFALIVSALYDYLVRERETKLVITAQEAQDAHRTVAEREQRQQQEHELLIAQEQLRFAALEKEKAETEKHQVEHQREREMAEKIRLQETITNSAHDIKSPICALSLGVESLMAILDSEQELSREDRLKAVDTLKGMSHTLSAMGMIINRSVDYVRESAGKEAIPHIVPVDLPRLLGNVLDFMKWQAEDTAIQVHSDPLPDELAMTDIMADLDWLREDLFCIGGNAIKYSQETSGIPVSLRVTIENIEQSPEQKSETEPTTTKPSEIHGKSFHTQEQNFSKTDSFMWGQGSGQGINNKNGSSGSSPSLGHGKVIRFSMKDSGHAVDAGKLSRFFDQPSHTERVQQGGMGLGPFCLHKHVMVLGGQCGARHRIDGVEGTEVWFTLPLKYLPSNQTGVHKTQSFVLDEESQLDMVHSHREKSARGVGVVEGHHHDTTKPAIIRTGSATGTPLLSLQVPRLDTGTGDGTVASSGSVSGPGSLSGPPLTVRSLFTRVSIANATPREQLSVMLTRQQQRVLIVDDSMAILKMMKRTLNNECPDVSVFQGKNGEEAYRQVVASKEGYPLILTDIQMPVSDGFDLTRRVRQLEIDRGWPRQVIIGISANDQEKIRKEAYEAGMDGFMLKPFKLAILLNVVDQIVDRQSGHGMSGNNSVASYSSRRRSINKNSSVKSSNLDALMGDD